MGADCIWRAVPHPAAPSPKREGGRYCHSSTLPLDVGKGKGVGYRKEGQRLKVLIYVPQHPSLLGEGPGEG